MAGGEVKPDDFETSGGASVAPGVVVPAGVLRWAFSRSSGPGGQNVNKLSTKAELRVGMEELPLPGRVKGRLRRLAGSKIIGATTQIDEMGRVHDVGGDIVLVSQTERSQSANKAECLEKLRELIVQAQHEPKVRRKTKPTKGSKERRLGEKKRRGEIKRDRRGGRD